MSLNGEGGSWWLVGGRGWEKERKKEGEAIDWLTFPVSLGGKWISLRGGGGWGGGEGVCSLSVSYEILLATSQDTDLTSYTCYICLFPQPEKISFPALISQHFPLCIRLTVALWLLLPSSAASSFPPLPWVTIVFELPFPLLHLITVSFDLLLALCEGGNLSSQTDGNLTKNSTASRSLLHPCCPYESSANASWSGSDPPRELKGLLPFGFWLDEWRRDTPLLPRLDQP